MSANISHYHLVNLTDSIYNFECYLKTDVNYNLSNDTKFCYTPTESIVAGLGASLQGIAGTILNFLVIVALLGTKSIRHEYITPSILSLVVTDLLFSTVTLPIMATRYFVR